MAVIEELNKIGSDVKDKLGKQLAISQVAGESYDKDLHIFLKKTLGMTSSITTKSMNEKKKALEIVGIKMEVIAEFAEIQKLFGDKVILDYPGLLALCKQQNLYFGSTSLFTGEITPEAIEETKAFDFIKAKHILSVGIKRMSKPVVEWGFTAMDSYDLMIVAPINMFDIGGGKNIFISNREIIEHEKGTWYHPKRGCPDKDPILILPFKSKDNEVYFVVITNWENS